MSIAFPPTREPLRPITATLTRFAPAPTGWLHLGHVLNALYVWNTARLARCRVMLRIEDLHVNALFQWLRQNLLLLLQILTVLFLIYALMDFRVHGRTRRLAPRRSGSRRLG